MDPLAVLFRTLRCTWRLDLIAQAQDVELLPGERRVVRFAVAIGRSTTALSRHVRGIRRDADTGHRRVAPAVAGDATVRACAAREYDGAGVEVWRREMTWAIEANRYYH